MASRQVLALLFEVRILAPQLNSLARGSFFLALLIVNNSWLGIKSPNVQPGTSVSIKVARSIDDINPAELYDRWSKNYDTGREKARNRMLSFWQNRCSPR